jgi:phosphoserine phosphatase
LGRSLILLTLLGTHREHLEQSSDQYVLDLLPSKKNSSIHERLIKQRNRGDAVYLVSNSIDIVISKLAHQLQVGFRASKFEFMGNYFNGKLATNLIGRKETVLGELVAEAEAGGPLIVYSDNWSDRSLLSIADAAYVIIPRNRKAGKWIDPRWHCIRVE